MPGVSFCNRPPRRLRWSQHRLRADQHCLWLRRGWALSESIRSRTASSHGWGGATASMKATTSVPFHASRSAAKSTHQNPRPQRKALTRLSSRSCGSGRMRCCHYPWREVHLCAIARPPARMARTQMRQWTATPHRSRRRGAPKVGPVGSYPVRRQAPDAVRAAAHPEEEVAAISA